MIPFNLKQFLKFFTGVLAAVAATFAIAIFGFQYEMTTADPWCAPIAAALAAYFLHLVFWPEETPADNS